MADTVTGSCHCGQFQYETSSELIAPHYCHCGDCRKLYGAVGAGFIVMEDQTRLSGTLSRYETRSDAGNRKVHLFCPVCGTPVGEQVDAFPGTLVLVPGTLDDASAFKPEMHFWVARKAPWTVIGDGLAQMDGQPSA